MSDQMPDEVWIDEDTINGEFYASPQQVMVTDVRYIRADLCEQAEAELAVRRADDESAADMLMIDIPEPGALLRMAYDAGAAATRRNNNGMWWVTADEWLDRAERKLCVSCGDFLVDPPATLCGDCKELNR